MRKMIIAAKNDNDIIELCRKTHVHPHIAMKFNISTTEQSSGKKHQQIFELQKL